MKLVGALRRFSAGSRLGVIHNPWQVVPRDERAQILGHLHRLMRDRAAEFDVGVVELPGIDLSVGTADEPTWWPIERMYGGFSYWLDGAREPPVLVVMSWCRVVQGSGRRHEVTADGARLVDEGFV